MDQIHTYRVWEGDTLITKDSETNDDIAVPAYVAEAAPDMVCGYHLAMIRPTWQVHPKYLYWAVASRSFQTQMSSFATGVTRFGLRQEVISSGEVPLPPIEEQRRIADFLDAETSLIDRLIEIKSQASKLIDERRISLTNQLCFQGLHSTGETKDNGVAPIGPVPTHWRVVRNKNILREVVDLSTDGSEELLTVSHITGVTPRSEKTVYMFLADSMEGYKICRPGDLVINTLWAWMGALGVSRNHGIVSPAYGVYRFTSDDVLPDYYDRLYRTPAYICEMTRYSKGVWTSRLRLYPESFLSLLVPVPPLCEQQEILDELDRELEPKRRLQESIQRSEIMLAERKQALITAAVTGQFDVSSASGRGVTAGGA